MGVLLMLMTIGGLVVAVILFAISLIGKKTWLAKFTVGAVAVWVVFYAVMLIGFSVASKEKTLAMNEPKEYCGFYLDCHMHTVVTGVRTAKQIGGRTATGEFYIVKLKVFSDARNPNIAFRLLEPKAEVTSRRGSVYQRVTEAENLLPTSQVRLDQDIRGKETVEKEIVFDISEPAGELKLLVTEGYGIDKYIEAVLVNDDDSIFHKQKYFGLSEQKESAGL